MTGTVRIGRENLLTWLHMLTLAFIKLYEDVISSSTRAIFLVHLFAIQLTHYSVLYNTISAFPLP